MFPHRNIHTFFILFQHWGWSPYWVHSALRPLLAYWTFPGWLWWWRSWCNEGFWQGKPKYSEKTCPDATLPTTNPTYQTRVRTRAAAVGSQRITASAMARTNIHKFTCISPDGKTHDRSDDILIDWRGHSLVLTNIMSSNHLIYIKTWYITLYKNNLNSVQRLDLESIRSQEHDYYRWRKWLI
jgi:hypothetical protein